MNRACLIASTLLATASANADIFLQRNGIDGEFVWRPYNSACYGPVGTYLDISQPLSQSGHPTSFTLHYSQLCYIGSTCSGPYTFGVFAGGGSVQLASGSTVSFRANCTMAQYQYDGPRGYQRGEWIDGSANWGGGFITDVGEANYPVTWVGQRFGFWGVRVLLSDGWHYGWVAASGSQTASPNAWQGRYRPGAYALEMTPNTPIRVPCRADINFDGVIDFFDYLDYVALFAAGNSAARYNSDTVLDFFDYLDFLVDYAAGSC